jgi:hypothetical protein
MLKVLLNDKVVSLTKLDKTGRNFDLTYGVFKRDEL